MGCDGHDRLTAAVRREQAGTVAPGLLAALPAASRLVAEPRGARYGAAAAWSDTGARARLATRVASARDGLAVSAST